MKCEVWKGTYCLNLYDNAIKPQRGVCNSIKITFKCQSNEIKIHYVSSLENIGLTWIAAANLDLHHLYTSYTFKNYCIGFFFCSLKADHYIPLIGDIHWNSLNHYKVMHHCSPLTPKNGKMWKSRMIADPRACAILPVNDAVYDRFPRFLHCSIQNWMRMGIIAKSVFMITIYG